MRVSMVSDNSPPGSNTSQVVKDELTQLGFNVNLQPVNHDVMYTKFCGVPKNTPNVCPNVAWGKDFNDAQSLSTRRSTATRSSRRTTRTGRC